MSISNDAELEGMKQVSEAVAVTLREMQKFTKPGISTKEIDEYGGRLLTQFGAKSAPALAYGFPGWTCISVNNEIAHGIPSSRLVQEGDLVNIDVSAELNGFWADNGGSFVVGADIHNHQKLVQASKQILQKAIMSIKGGVRIAEIGRLIEGLAKKEGYKVIKNLTGHGVGRKLHEAPEEIPNFHDRFNRSRFRKNSVVAVETFISTHSSLSATLKDGWTMVGNKGGFVAQHEHTLVITDGKPLILTHQNGIY